MAESYEKRVAAAQVQRQIAVDKRSLFYPGSPEWENENAKVAEWQRAIDDLMRAQES